MILSMFPMTAFTYLLIGHWYTRDAAANAAKKAFICNRVGDFGFLIGILTLWALTNTCLLYTSNKPVSSPANSRTQPHFSIPFPSHPSS